MGGSNPQVFPSHSNSISGSPLAHRRVSAKVSRLTNCSLEEKKGERQDNQNMENHITGTLIMSKVFLLTSVQVDNTIYKRKRWMKVENQDIENHMRHWLRHRAEPLQKHTQEYAFVLIQFLDKETVQVREILPRIRQKLIYSTFSIPWLCCQWDGNTRSWDISSNSANLGNILRPRQNGRHFPDDIFKWIYLNENVWISINISLKFIPKGPINNIPTLVQVMAWHRPGDKPLSKPMMVRLPMHICVIQPQWVKVMLKYIIFWLTLQILMNHQLLVRNKIDSSSRFWFFFFKNYSYLFHNNDMELNVKMSRYKFINLPAEACIWAMDKELHPTDTTWCNYFSMPYISASGTYVTNNSPCPIYSVVNT